MVSFHFSNKTVKKKSKNEERNRTNRRKKKKMEENRISYSKIQTQQKKIAKTHFLLFVFQSLHFKNILHLI